MPMQQQFAGGGEFTSPPRASGIGATVRGIPSGIPVTRPHQAPIREEEGHPFVLAFLSVIALLLLAVVGFFGFSYYKAQKAAEARLKENHAEVTNSGSKFLASVTNIQETVNKRYFPTFWNDMVATARSLNEELARMELSLRNFNEKTKLLGTADTFFKSNNQHLAIVLATSARQEAKLDEVRRNFLEMVNQLKNDPNRKFAKGLYDEIIYFKAAPGNDWDDQISEYSRMMKKIPDATKAARDKIFAFSNSFNSLKRAYNMINRELAAEYFSKEINAVSKFLSDFDSIIRDPGRSPDEDIKFMDNYANELPIIEIQAYQRKCDEMLSLADPKIRRHDLLEWARLDERAKFAKRAPNKNDLQSLLSSLQDLYDKSEKAMKNFEKERDAYYEIEKTVNTNLIASLLRIEWGIHCKNLADAVNLHRYSNAVIELKTLGSELQALHAMVVKYQNASNYFRRLYDKANFKDMETYFPKEDCRRIVESCNDAKHEADIKRAAEKLQKAGKELEWVNGMLSDADFKRIMDWIMERKIKHLETLNRIYPQRVSLKYYNDIHKEAESFYELNSNKIENNVILKDNWRDLLSEYEKRVL